MTLERLMIADLENGDRLKLTCRTCDGILTLTGARVQSLAYGFRPVEDFAAMHICAACGRTGASVEVLPQSDQA